MLIEVYADSTGVNGYLIGGYPTYVFITKDLKIDSGAVGFNEQHIRSTIDGCYNVQSI